MCKNGPDSAHLLRVLTQRIVNSGSFFNLWNQMQVFAGNQNFCPNKIPDYCWLLSASGHLVSLSCAQSLNWNYWLTRITEQRLILFQILKSYWNDFPLYNKELKIFECGDQIIPIPNQRNNCNVCLRLRKEIPVNSAKIQEFVQPLLLSVRDSYVLRTCTLGCATPRKARIDAISCKPFANILLSLSTFKLHDLKN